MRRYPLAELIEASGLTEAALGRRVGLSGSSLVKARELGLVERAADRCAVRVGLVPWQVWPEWFEDTYVTCAERSCSVRFVPSRKGHVYCSKQCGTRVASRDGARRRYDTDPEYRLQKIAYAKTYRTENRDYVLTVQARQRERVGEARKIRDRAYYQANREQILAKKREFDRRRREARVA